MDIESLKVGDLIKIIRKNSHLKLHTSVCGVFLGATHDITPSRMQNYIRIHMLEVDGRVFSTIFWRENDEITKIS